MTQEYKIPLSCVSGFYPSAAIVGDDRILNSIRDGRNMWYLGRGLMKSAKLPALSGVGLGGPRLYLVGSQIGVIDTGSVIIYKNGIFLFIGSGNVFVGTGQVGIGSSLLAYNTGFGLGTVKPVGLNQPGAPVVEVGGSGINSGSYAAVITRVNSTTGGESNGSLPSAPISVTNKKIKIVFGGLDGGQDRWGIYFTPKGRATVGPFFFLKEIADSSIPGDRRVEFEFYDSQLTSQQPPTDHNPPPQGTHVVNLGPNIIVLGTFPGNGAAAGVSPSIANKIEAYPALYTTFLNPLGDVVGTTARPTDGETLVWTKNSLQALILTGSSAFPVLPRAIWPTTGIEGAHGAVFADSILYAYAGTAGPVRLGGLEPDTTFAEAVYEFIRSQNWDPASVVVGYDRVRDAVVYMGSGTDGNLALCFMRSVQDGRTWSPPIELPGTPESCITVNGILKISINGQLYDWEAGNGGNWYVIPAWRDDPDPSDRKTFRGYRAVVNTGVSPVQFDLLLDLSDTPVASASQSTTGSGNRQTPWKLLNKLCRQFTLKASGSGAGHMLHDMQTVIWHEAGILDK